MRTSPDRSEPRGSETDGRRIDAGILVALATLLLLWFLWPFVAGGHGLPVGPDVPVYLWWIRLGGAEGLSAVGHRPGVPGLALALGGTLGRSEVETLAALEIALGPALGLAAATLVRHRSGRAAWALAGTLAGTFAVHLAAGYLANLALAVLFLASATALAEGTRRGTVAAAALLAAGGLAHPLFLLLAALVLVLTALLSLRSRELAGRDDAVRIGAALAGGGVTAGLGSAALLVGPDPLAVDTSRDGFLRRAGLEGVLRGAYLDRFVRRWARYVQWASVPLAALGLFAGGGFLRRFLVSWAVVLMAGVGLSLASGWAPADRFVTFGFAVPILAALGLVRLWRLLEPRRPLALALTGGLTLAMLAGAFFPWNRQEPFLSELELERLAAANRVVAATEPGTAVVAWVNEEEGPGTFLAARAGNMIRAAVPPGRIRDVVVLVPPREDDASADPDLVAERSALARLTRRDVALAVAAAGGARVDLLLAPFDRVDLPVARRERRWTRAAEGVFVQPAVVPVERAVDPLGTSTPGAIAVSGLLAFVFLSAVGFGWSRAATGDPLDSAALAPSLGAATVILAALLLDLLGVRLDGGIGPVVASGGTGAGGYFLWLVLERRARTRPAP